MSDQQAQIFSLDLVLSLVGFTIILIFLISSWNIYSARLQENMVGEELQLTAMQMTDILTKSEGQPMQWENNPSNVSLIGLALRPGSLDEDKVNAFVSMDYNQVKKLFNIKRFEYRFMLFGINGTIQNVSGMIPSNSSSQVTSVSRYILLHNETRQLVFTLWKD